MKLIAITLVVCLSAVLSERSSAAANCEVPGYLIVGTQSVTDHGWVKAGTTCRLNRQLQRELTPVIFEQPTHGHLTVKRSYWSYAPDKHFKGIDRFIFGFTGPRGNWHRTVIMAVE
jgi:hypothetical protein